MMLFLLVLETLALGLVVRAFWHQFKGLRDLRDYCHARTAESLELRDRRSDGVYTLIADGRVQAYSDIQKRLEA